MGTCRLDDNFHNHPKALAAKPYGRDLYVAGIEYANRFFTDGFIPKAAVPTLAPGLPAPWRWASELVTVGLWEQAEAGYRIHDWLEWNPSATERKARLFADRDRKRRRRSPPDNSGRNPEVEAEAETEFPASSPVSFETVDDAGTRERAPSAPAAPASSVIFQIPESIEGALNKCRRLGRVPRLREPGWWQDHVRAYRGLNYAQEVRDAEAYLATVPGRYTDLARFLHNSLARSYQRLRNGSEEA
jgi:hypothetical protein